MRARPPACSLARSLVALPLSPSVSAPKTNSLGGATAAASAAAAAAAAAAATGAGVGRVFDAVRGMVVCSKMTAVAAAVRRFAGDPRLVLVRAKERFLAAPSAVCAAGIVFFFPSVRACEC